jgi:hypothetical protein
MEAGNPAQLEAAYEAAVAQRLPASYENSPV